MTLTFFLKWVIPNESERVSLAHQQAQSASKRECKSTPIHGVSLHRTYTDDAPRRDTFPLPVLPKLSRIGLLDTFHGNRVTDSDITDCGFCPGVGD